MSDRQGCRQRLEAGRFFAGKDIVLVLAGNKVDLERNRQVPEEEASAYAKSIGAELFGTSAKVNRGVEPAFASIAESARRRPRPAARLALLGELFVCGPTRTRCPFPLISTTQMRRHGA